MTATTRARTARIPHLCENCHWNASLRGQPTIFPGHRYVLHTAFPGDEANNGDRPFSLKMCADCEIRGYRTDRRAAGACGTACCGETVCALLLDHNADHECRRCGARKAGI